MIRAHVTIRTALQCLEYDAIGASSVDILLAAYDVVPDVCGVTVEVIA